MKKYFLLLVSTLLMNALAAQKETVSGEVTFNHLSSSIDTNYLSTYSDSLDFNDSLHRAILDTAEISDLNRMYFISDQLLNAEETNVAISYAPLYGFWLGPWLLSANLSIANGYFEWSTTLAIIHESDLNVSGSTLYTLVGPRYVFHSKSKTHFFVHSLLGFGFHKESQKKANGFFQAFNESHFGLYFSPGLGVYFKKPSKSGFRLGGDFVVATGFPKGDFGATEGYGWISSYTYAIQLSVGIIF